VSRIEFKSNNLVNKTQAASKEGTMMKRSIRSLADLDLHASHISVHEELEAANIHTERYMENSPS
jgi:hypothetical protein